MTNISKNIKKYRKQSNLTQEQLAEQMHLTRQAISNWENDKSQPDISSVAQLAEIFGISVEEMIYGSTRRVGIEENYESRINVMKVVLSVFGWLFLAAGIIILFVAFWKDFPQGVKNALSFLPICISLAFCTFVYFKRQNKTVWREIAGIVWCVGGVATVLLANNSINAFGKDFIFYYINIEWLFCVAICIPPIFILKSISALPVLFYFQLALGIGYINKEYFNYSDYGLLLSEEELQNKLIYDNIAPLVLVAVLIICLAIGFIYMLLARSRRDDVRYKLSLWLCAVDFIAVFAVICFASEWLNARGFAYAVLAFASYCLISERGRGYTLPFRILGTLGLAATALLENFLFFIENEYRQINSPEHFAVILISLLVALSIAYALPDLGKIGYSLPLYIASIAAAIYVLSHTANLSTVKLETVQIVLTVFAALIGVAFIIKGVQRLALFEINVGIITVFAALMRLSNALFDYHLFTLGGLLVAFGTALFFANFLVSKKKKAFNSQPV